jgi:hypothetical protein
VIPVTLCSGIPALGRLRKEHHEIENNMVYITRSCLKEKGDEVGT